VAPSTPPAGDPGLFGPHSATWRLHSDPLIGLAGLRALLLQALHPVAMRAVHDHSRFRDETWDRLATTADYVGTTTFGSTPDALQLAARVRAVHASIRGVDPETGMEYGADDEDLLLWIHCALVDSIVDVVSRGTPLSAADQDRYVAEQVRSAALVGLEPEVVPTTRADLDAYLEEVRPELRATRAAREAASYIVAPPVRPVVALALPAWAGMAGLAFAALPAWARRLYALPEVPGAAGLHDAATTLALRTLRVALSGVQAVVPPLREGRHLRQARARVAAGVPTQAGPERTGGRVVDLTATEGTDRTAAPEGTDGAAAADR
jgi:uncharacterized protein (DUF2236 family)